VRSMPSKKSLHVFNRVDGHADLAHFSGGERVIGIEAICVGRSKAPTARWFRWRADTCNAYSIFCIAHARVLAHVQRRRDTCWLDASVEGNCPG